MGLAHQAIMKMYRETGQVEGIQGIYDRVQKLKECLKEEIDEETAKFLAESSRNKILVVTHNRVLESFTAKGVGQKPATESSAAENYLIDKKYFDNCEVYPFFAE